MNIQNFSPTCRNMLWIIYSCRLKSCPFSFGNVCINTDVSISCYWNCILNILCSKCQPCWGGPGHQQMHALGDAIIVVVKRKFNASCKWLSAKPEPFLCLISSAESSKDVIYPTHRNWALKHIKQHGKYCCFLGEVSTFPALLSDVNWSVLLYSFL